MYKYQQLSQTLRSQIEKGIYQKGDRLPSIRELTEQYCCNKDTVLKALQQLKDESLLYPVEKSGYYVMKNATRTSNLRPTGLPNPRQFPIDDFRRCLNESLLALQDVEVSDDIFPQGNPELLEAIHPLFESYGVYAPVDQMVVTTGTQQALYLLLQLIGREGLLIEQPTYGRMNQLVNSLHIPYQTIQRTLEGDSIDLVELERLFASGTIRYFYTISRFHQPFGISYSDAVKQKMVELAARYHVYIIEDDYMADYEKGTATPLHYFDIHDRIIYVKSFSSILFASFKIGVVVLPKVLVEQFTTLKQLLDYDSNHLMQKTLALYISNGMFLKHRQKMVEHYHTKSKLLSAITDLFVVHGMQVMVTEEVYQQIAETLPEGTQVDDLGKAYIVDKSPYRVIDFSNVLEEKVMEWIHIIKGESV